ncbi:MAG: yxjC [Hyphomicrobiales bacterium]|nr:yxjC [Hyphomicrobiales bacterium]
MSLFGILLALSLLMWMAYRGWSVLLLAPASALVAAGMSGEPLLAHWTQTFMESGSRFIAQFFPLFLLGALFGKLMDDSGSISAISTFMTKRLGTRRAMLAVVLSSAVVTYGGVSVFVAFFVLVPMAQALFKSADIPKRLMPAAIALGTLTFTMTALPGTPALQNAIPMPFFGTTPFAAPGLGIIASAIIMAFGMWWLGRAEGRARLAGEGYGVQEIGVDASSGNPDSIANNEKLREHATLAREFDPAEIGRGKHGDSEPPIAIALAPLVVVILVNFIMSLLILPRLDFSFLADEAWGATSLSAVAGVWSVVVALAAAIVTILVFNRGRLPSLRESMDAGANASVLPALTVGSLVGFGAVIASMPAFAMVRDWVLAVQGGPLVSLAVAMNVLAALTGSASGGMAIALDALGATYLKLALENGIDPALMHRVAVLSSGTLDSLPHNGTILTLLAVSGTTHSESCRDIVMVVIVGVIIALVAVIALGSLFGSF